MAISDEILIEDLVILAASLQLGTDVTPIRLIGEIRLREPGLSNVSIAHLIDNLESRSLGTIRPPHDEAGEREFLIDFRGVEFARQVNEQRRPKSIIEKLRQWSRTDWMALCALVVSALSLGVSILALKGAAN